MVQFVFNLIPISTNRLYGNIPGQARRFVSKEGKEFKQTIESEVTKALTPESLLYLSSLSDKRLVVDIQVHSASWLLKDGSSIRKKDLANVEKGLLDSIFSTFEAHNLDLDDSQIFELHMYKIYSNIEKTVVTIFELP